MQNEQAATKKIRAKLKCVDTNVGAGNHMAAFQVVDGAGVIANDRIELNQQAGLRFEQGQEYFLDVIPATGTI